MSQSFTDSEVEEAAFSYFEELGYTILHGHIAPDEPNAERATPSDVILKSCPRSALAQITPSIPPEAFNEAVWQALCSAFSGSKITAVSIGSLWMECVSTWKSKRRWVLPHETAHSL